MDAISHASLYYAEFPSTIRRGFVGRDWLCADSRVDQFGKRPHMSCHALRHRWRCPQRFMGPHKIVVHHIKRDSGTMIIELF